MLFFEAATLNNTSKDANGFAPSCSFADNNSNNAFLSGIAFAVPVFLSVMFIDIVGIIIPISMLPIMCKNIKRKRQFAS